jgi:hypothetical protein
MKDKRDMKGGGNAPLRIQIAINVRQGELHVGEGVEEVLEPAREVVEDELAEGFGFLCVLSTWCFSVLSSGETESGDRQRQMAREMGSE